MYTFTQLMERYSFILFARLGSDEFLLGYFDKMKREIMVRKVDLDIKVHDNKGYTMYI